MKRYYAVHSRTGYAEFNVTETTRRRGDGKSEKVRSLRIRLKKKKSSDAFIFMLSPEEVIGLADALRKALAVVTGRTGAGNQQPESQGGGIAWSDSVIWRKNTVLRVEARFWKSGGRVKEGVAITARSRNNSSKASLVLTNSTCRFLEKIFLPRIAYEIAWIEVVDETDAETKSVQPANETKTQFDTADTGSQTTAPDSVYDVDKDALDELLLGSLELEDSMDTAEEVLEENEGGVESEENSEEIEGDFAF